MGASDLMDKLLFVQIVLLAGVVSLIFMVSSSYASQLYLFEIFGALVASIITVFGVSRMKRLT